MSRADQVAFEQAMVDADISVRELERCVSKLSNHLDRLYAAEGAQQRQTYYAHCRTQINRLERYLKTAPLSDWREKHSPVRRRRSQQTQQRQLESKLKVARGLLAEHGIDLDEHLPRSA